MQMEAALHAVWVSKCPLPPHTPPSTSLTPGPHACATWVLRETRAGRGIRVNNASASPACEETVSSVAIVADMSTHHFIPVIVLETAKMKYLNNRNMILELTCSFSRIHQICRKARVNVVVFSSFPTATDWDPTQRRQQVGVRHTIP